MKKSSKKISTFPKSYLEWAGFSIKALKPRFLGRISADAVAAMIYSFASVVLIWIQHADLVVFGLNILCLFRAIINNTILASEVTLKSKNPDIAHKQKKNRYYHVKAGFLITCFVFSVVIWTVLLYEGNNTTILIRFFASISILLVLINDSENMAVCAYNASIEP